LAPAQEAQRAVRLLLREQLRARLELGYEAQEHRLVGGVRMARVGHKVAVEQHDGVTLRSQLGGDRGGERRLACAGESREPERRGLHAPGVLLIPARSR
jgi:hypothetical protein